MIKVTYRDKQWEVPGRQAVREVIEAVGLNPAIVLAVRDGKLVLDSEMLGDDDELKLIAVISGGCSRLECPFSVNASSLQNKLILLDILPYTGFLTARQRGLLTLPEEDAPALRICEQYGQPTSTEQGLCAFCRLWA